MEKATPHSPVYADDAKESVSLLLKLRLPWLFVGALGGLAASVVVSRFEAVLAENIHLAFFLPVIVYMSDAVGTQTATIFVRNLGNHKSKMHLAVYVVKELALGLILGTFLGILLGCIAGFWLGEPSIGWTVGIAMFINIMIAPVLALVVPTILSKEHTDPALGVGPFTTVIQDIVSLSVYLFVAMAILFR